ncbi:MULTISPECIES: O-antigen ligase family protein [unclassified Rhizobium]|uniref:O-antigen ligase family protein n=1 Tax=unclassified Rhizobium TaxID=2613769 RepID=UPI000EAAC685|nr:MULTISPECIES: O-antigen ligase family protein [unclassified Rhizobium]AYG69726.1 O-antigen ligase domain-containing protein [Rhizobium sp. CCGE531]AYG76101.1 O-antigen ligase domain-containing protein [Rhizobium sp. CCGE532]
MNGETHSLGLTSFSDRRWAFIVDGLWLAIMSASLIESYTYRYAGGLLVLISLVLYVRSSPRPSIDWRGWLCLAWGTYALLRFSLQFALQSDHPIGDRDLLFLMPLTFPPFAYILFRCWTDLEKLIAVYFGFALVVLLWSMPIDAIVAGKTIIPLMQHNQIHGAVCCGMIFIGATFWLLYYLTEGADRRTMRLYASVLSPLICLLCLLGIYGAKSKGVWLSLVPVLPILAFLTVRSLKRRLAVPLVLTFLLLLSGGVYAVRDNLDRIAGPTISATLVMFEDAGATEPIGQAVSRSIENSSTPIAMSERLQLWANAWELFSAAPFFGWGSEWLALWPHTRYPNVGYTFMHNGYLEILIRHGVFGLAIFGAMLACFCDSVRRAVGLGIIPRHAMHAYFLILFFFSMTILSNSNNRLVSGESLSILTAAFALACQLRIRMHTGLKPASHQEAKE